MLIDLLYLQKKTDLTEFAIIKPRHPVGLEKKTDLGGKKTAMGPWLQTSVATLLLRKSTRFHDKKNTRFT